MTLSAKQEAFTRAYLETGNASEAYRRAYNADNMQPGTVNREATRLLANPLITTRIAELQAAAAKAAVVDRAYVLRGLVRVYEMAVGDQPVKRASAKAKTKGEPADEHMVDLKAANRALELIGKTDEVRAFVELHEHGGRNGEPLVPSDVEPRAIARAVLDLIRSGQPSTPKDADRDGEADSSPASPRGASSAPRSTARTGEAGRPVRAAAARRSPPAELEPGESEVLDNGATIQLVAEFGRFAVHDGDGRLAGHRPDLTEARKLAQKLKAPTPKENR